VVPYPPLERLRRAAVGCPLVAILRATDRFPKRTGVPRPFSAGSPPAVPSDVRSSLPAHPRQMALLATPRGACSRHWRECSTQLACTAHTTTSAPLRRSSSAARRSTCRTESSRPQRARLTEPLTCTHWDGPNASCAHPRQTIKPSTAPDGKRTTTSARTRYSGRPRARTHRRSRNAHTPLPTQPINKRYRGAKIIGIREGWLHPHPGPNASTSWSAVCGSNP
jgi:hypothetical protein